MKKYKFITAVLSLLIIAASSLMICNAINKPVSAPEDPASRCSSAVWLDFSNAAAEGVLPVKLGNKTFVPLEPVSKMLGLKLEAQKNGEFVLNSDSNKIKGKAGSTEVMVNGKKQYLPLPVMKIENQIFVPDQFVKQCLNNRMYYNEKNGELMIQKK